MASLVATPVQSALLFAVDFGGDDDLYALRLGALDNLVRVVSFVSQKSLRRQSIEQLGHRFGVVPLPGSQHKAQRVAQGVADGVDFGITPAARDADGLRTATLARACRRLVRPAARRVHHHLMRVGLLYALQKALEVALVAPVRIALVHRVRLAQSLG